jgi:period circadian protein
MDWNKSKILSRPIRRHNPPWLENIKITPDLILRYQLNLPEAKDVLQDDLLRITKQPDQVNDQLSQLYLDLELEGLSARLSLSDSSGSCGESSGEDQRPSSKDKKKKYLYLVDICNRIEGENSSS